MTDYARLKSLIFAWYDGQVPAENGDIKFGENVHWMKTDDAVNASDVIEDWYFNEEPKWNYDDPHVTPETQNFSQLLWNSTVRFGCGQAASKGSKGGTWTVCYYDPSGNTPGEEKINVFKSTYDEDESESSTEESTTSSSSGDSSTVGSSSGGSSSEDSSPPTPALLRDVVKSQKKLGVKLDEEYFF